MTAAVVNTQHDPAEEANAPFTTQVYHIRNHTAWNLHVHTHVDA